MTKKSSFQTASETQPPINTKRPVSIDQHGETRCDNYAWMRDDDWQTVLRDPSTLNGDIRVALDAENNYYSAITDDLEELRKQLFDEMRARIKEDDSSVPAKDGPWRYWTRFRDGGEYPIFMRAPASGGDEEVLFDGDEERGSSEFFSIGSIDHSPDHKLLAMAVDRLGSEYFTINIRDLESGDDYSETIESADGVGAVWAADSKSFFYIERDDSQRPKRVKHHFLGTDASADKIVYEESDDGFFLAIDKSQSGDFIFIRSGSHTTSEVWFIPADKPEASPTLIAARENGVEYDVEHHDDDFLIHTNADGAVDFKIVKTPVDSPGKKHWRDVIAHQAGRQIVTLITYRDFLVRMERENALPRIVVSDYHGEEYEISFDEAAFSLGVLPGYEYATTTLRYSYQSPTTPAQTFDFDLTTKNRTLLKTQEVPSGHDPAAYVVERIQATGTDGTKIPLTILRLKSTEKDSTAPAMLYGYGSYGYASPANFSTGILSLVNRGMVYAIAHVRGGSDKGRQWYLDGKLDKKMNTFTDFITCAQSLNDNGYASPGNIVIYGGSAGGLLVGASVNLRPDLFAGVLAAVPFVDVLTTISDASLPLTPPEWDEWGNPIKHDEHYKWISQYSPYDNISAQTYPPIMATGGLTDYRVTYWEPAKWIARLRDEARGGPFVLRMNMGAGHAGSAARFERLDENAHLYAFALKCVGLEKAEPLVK